MALYERTTAAAKALDDSRPASGSMTPDARKNWQREWHEDVFAFDDYHSAPDNSVGIDAPLPAVPYMLAEVVGQFSYGSKGFNNKYRRAADVTLKERRKLVLMARESPLNEIHLENMLTLSRMGVTILPPVPGFYSKPQTIDDVVNHIVGRLLDQFGLDMPGMERWSGF